MNIWKIGWMGIVIILILTAIPYALSQQDQMPLVNGTGIYLSTGQTWTFYQGYSLTLKSVSNDGDRGWVQLKLNDTVVKSALVSPGEVFYYNVSTNDSNETVLFRITVSGIYSGEDTDIITFDPVYQYYNPALPEPTPTLTPPRDNSDNISNISTPMATSGIRIPGFCVLPTVIIICLCSILVRRL